MKKIYLTDRSVPQYKAELHTHSACSDGRSTPEELKQLYKERGFSVVAFTDHDVFLRHNELSDSGFIALNSLEICVAASSGEETEVCKQVHLNLIATSPDIDEMPFYNPDFIFSENAKKYIGKIKYSDPIEYRVNTPEWLNGAIARANEKGFFVTYNHPVWSLVDPKDYLPLEGLFAVEVWNTGCISTNAEDGAAFRETVMSGKHVYAVAANDYHYPTEYDAMQAAVYVCTKDFSYGGIINALKDGKFYSSCGPVIEEMYIEGDSLKIKCSPVRSVNVAAHKNLRAAYSESGDLTEAEFTLSNAHKRMFYVVLEDKYGRKAWSNPVWNYDGDRRK